MNELYTEEQMNMTKHRLRLLRKEKGFLFCCKSRVRRSVIPICAIMN